MFRLRQALLTYLAVVIFSTLPKGISATTDSLGNMAHDYWAWRAQYQPFSQDDIPRIEHPSGTRSWSAASIATQRAELVRFEERWRKLAPGQRSVTERVDWRLIGSALARVRWELDVTKRWEKDPTFYVDQTMTAVLEALLPPPPFSAARAREVSERLRNVASILEEARANLHPAKPFAELAIDELSNVRQRLATVGHELSPMLPEASRAAFKAALESASGAEERYRDWLRKGLPTMPSGEAIGRKNYEFFLHNVALVSDTPEHLVAMSRQEWQRSVTFQVLEEHRDKGVPSLPLASSLEAQQRASEKDEEAIREFLEAKDLLTVPSSMQHYVVRPIPAYLAPLAPFGELDDFTSEHRSSESGVRWTPEPAPQLGYFALASAKDPRPIIVHEGVPGHYFQLCLSWSNPDPIRRQYYDSGANEGIGFYAEEMMLEAGLFDNSPHTREIIYNFMRLRALRVEVDVKLALGQFTIEQAAGYLAQAVPMDRQTAHSEAQLFASTPGQAISYQVGKLQILRFLADAKTKEGEQFQLRRFHDFVWRNGNVPIALQRWEYLGQSDEVPPLTSDRR